VQIQTKKNEGWIKMPHPKGGYYVDNQRVPGVTTILGRFKESGGLIWWAFEQGKAAQRGEISGLYDKRDEAADAGTLAHSLVEAHINNEDPPEIPDTEIGEQARQGFENYLNWQDNNKIIVKYQELELVSKKHKFGGCPDGVGIDSAFNICLLDWKTSNGIYVDYLCQITFSFSWDLSKVSHPSPPSKPSCMGSKDAPRHPSPPCLSCAHTGNRGRECLFYANVFCSGGASLSPNGGMSFVAFAARSSVFTWARRVLSMAFCSLGSVISLAWVYPAAPITG